MEDDFPYTALASHAEGYMTQAAGDYSHAENIKTIARGYASHAEGNMTQATGDYSHAEGLDTEAEGESAHAEGWRTSSKGNHSHAEGLNTQANGSTAHAEGGATIARGEGSHAEGCWSRAEGDYSHAEGESTIATGYASHAEGFQASSKGNHSHAEGEYTIATGRAQHVQGIYNIENSNYAHIVGNGLKEDEYDTDGKLIKQNRSNAHTLDWEGNAWFAGDVTIGENSEKLITENKVNSQLEEMNNTINSQLEELESKIAADQFYNLEIENVEENAPFNGTSTFLPTDNWYEENYGKEARHPFGYILEGSSSYLEFIKGDQDENIGGRGGSGVSCIVDNDPSTYYWQLSPRQTSGELWLSFPIAIKINSIQLNFSYGSNKNSTNHIVKIYGINDNNSSDLLCDYIRKGVSASESYVDQNFILNSNDYYQKYKIEFSFPSASTSSVYNCFVFSILKITDYTLPNNTHQINYVCNEIPTQLFNNQKFYIQTPNLNNYIPQNNTINSINCNTILQPNKRYELLYNKTSFDAKEV